jgi:hypothetical protein
MRGDDSLEFASSAHLDCALRRAADRASFRAFARGQGHPLGDCSVLFWTEGALFSVDKARHRWLRWRPRPAAYISHLLAHPAIAARLGLFLLLNERNVQRAAVVVAQHNRLLGWHVHSAEMAPRAGHPGLGIGAGDDEPVQQRGYKRRLEPGSALDGDEEYLKVISDNGDAGNVSDDEGHEGIEEDRDGQEDAGREFREALCSESASWYRAETRTAPDLGQPFAEEDDRDDADGREDSRGHDGEGGARVAMALSHEEWPVAIIRDQPDHTGKGEEEVTRTPCSNGARVREKQ